MNMKNTIIATTHLQASGDVFTVEALEQLANSVPSNVGIPVFLDFDQKKAIGEAVNPKVVDEKLHMDIIIDEGYQGYTVPGYYVWADNSLELTCIGLTENPEDTTVDYWHDK